MRPRSSGFLLLQTILSIFIMLTLKQVAVAGYGYTFIYYNHPNVEAVSYTVIYQWEATRCEYIGGYEECWRVLPAVELRLFDGRPAHVGNSYDVCECTHVRAGIIFPHPYPRGVWVAAGFHWSYVTHLQSGFTWENWYCPSFDAVDITCNDDEKDYLIAEYGEYGYSWYPQCNDFVEGSNLNFGDYRWAVIDTVAAGVAGWETEFRKQTNYTIFSITDAYRNPSKNWRVGGAHESKHVYGRAADVDVISNTGAEAQVIAAALQATSPSYWYIAAGNRYVHAQW